MLQLSLPKDKEIVNISLSDIHGKIIQEHLKFESLDNKISFAPNDLEHGIYFIKATTNDGQQKTLKLIRQ